MSETLIQTSIQYKKHRADTLATIYQGCGFTEPAWSWYEPVPESLIGSGITPPLKTLTRGKPDIPEPVKFSELMLFGDKKGLTVIPAEGGQYQYFYWREAKDKNEGETSLDCHKQTETIYMKSKSVLSEQFTVSLDDNNMPECFEMTRYYVDNQCIVWTIMELSHEQM